jgi:exonuclease SbcD
MRILALSDTQLDSGRSLSPTRLADQEAGLAAVAQLADDRNVDIVLHCGDVYEHRHPSEEARMVFKRFARKIQSQDRRLIVVAGNHCLSNADTPSSIDVHDGFTFARQQCVIDIDEASLVCLPWTPMARLIAHLPTMPRDNVNDIAVGELLKIARDLYGKCATDKPAVLALHWWLDEATAANGTTAAFVTEPVLPVGVLTDIGFDAVIAGHVHNPQILNIAPPVFYCGPPMLCNFGEVEIEHGVWVIDTENPDALEFIPIPDRRFVTVDVDLTDPGAAFSGADETDQIAAAVAEQFPLDGAVLRLRYTASEEQHRRVDPGALRRLALDAGAHRVYQIDPTIIRPDRARVSIDRALGEHDALGAWCDANEIPAERAEQLHEILTESRALTAAGAGGAAFDPLELTARNVGRFHDIHLDLRDGATVLLGPNGSGKSTALRCLELALYADDAGDLREILAPWADELELELRFTLNGEEHRVRRALRGVKRTGSGQPTAGKATLDFEVLVVEEPGGSWLPLTRETAKATQKHLVEQLGMSRALFRASCFLAQGDGPAFLTAEPRNRKALAAELLDPAGLWAADAAFANTHAKTVDQELVAGRARVETLEPLAATAAAIEDELRLTRDELDLATANMKAADGRLEEALAAEAANAEAAAGVRVAAAECDTARAAVDQAREKAGHAAAEAAKVAPAKERLAGLEELVEEIPALEQKAAERATAALQIESLRRQKADAEAAVERHLVEIRRLQEQERSTDTLLTQATGRLIHLRDFSLDGVERCDRCDQLLGTEARAAAIESMSVQVEDLTARNFVEQEQHAEASRILVTLQQAAIIELPSVAAEDVSARLAEARASVERVATGRALIAQYEQAAEQIDQLHADLAAASAVLLRKIQALEDATEGVKDPAELAEDIRIARANVELQRRSLATLTAAVAKLEERHQAALNAAQEIDMIRRDSQAAQARLDVLRLAERAFGRDGIPVLLLETVLPQIDADANEILRRLPTADGWTFSVRFETQREQASTDRLREELFVMVTAPDYDQDFRTLSGGEESRVAFAVRVALAMLLGRIRGADSRVLTIDELPFLDEGGDAALVDLVNDLVTQGTFTKVLTVSHSPAVRDAFAQTIVIEKTDGVSRITTDQPSTAPVRVAA